MPIPRYFHTSYIYIIYIDRSTCQAHGNYPLRVSVALAQARALLHRRAAARLAHPPCCALRGSARTSSALRALRARCAARTSSALTALAARAAQLAHPPRCMRCTRWARLGATYCTLRAKVLRGKTFDWCTVTWSAFSLTSEPWRLRGLLTVPSDCQWYTRSCRAGASWKSWKSWKSWLDFGAKTTVTALKIQIF